MKKAIITMIIGGLIGFALGVNFGRDRPLWSNPFEAKPDFQERVIERAGQTMQDAKDAIHEATEPVRKDAGK